MRRASQSPRSPKRQRIASSSPTRIDNIGNGRAALTIQTHSRRLPVSAPSTANAPILAARPSHPPTSPSTHLPPAKHDTPAAQKRRFTRSRSGCSTCRSRKVKCDDERPHCRRYIEDGRTCQAYHQQQPQQQKQQLPSSSSQTQAQHRPASWSNEQLLAHSHRSNPSRPGQEHRPQSLHASSTAASDAFADYPATSPQHLDDWIDLLCASIGNHISQPSAAAAVARDQAMIANNGPLDDKQAQQRNHTLISSNTSIAGKKLTPRAKTQSSA